VAIDGDYVVVGAYADNGGAPGSGSAYFYDLTSAEPTTPVATLLNPAPQSIDQFGIGVAIAGNRAVVGAHRTAEPGAPQAGSAFVFDYGVVQINSSTIDGNTAGSAGGGIYNAGMVTISESTIAENTAAAGDGGGIYNAVDATANISASTIADNSAIAFDLLPVSQYEAEGNATDSISDSDGVLLGSTTFAAGQVGQAFNFDASSGTRVEVPGLSSFQSQSFTIEAWVMRTTLGATTTRQAV
jgi:hypothetical protein